MNGDSKEVRIGKNSYLTVSLVILLLTGVWFAAIGFQSQKDRSLDNASNIVRHEAKVDALEEVDAETLSAIREIVAVQKAQATEIQDLKEELRLIRLELKR